LVNGTNGGDGLSNPTEETIEKIRKSCKENWKNKISYNKGKSMEEVFGLEKAKIIKKQISDKQKGKILSDEHKNKISINHSRHNVGKKMSENVKAQIRKGYESKKNEFYFNAKKIEKFSKPIIQMDLNNNFVNFWNSIKEASETLKINRNHIGDCCHGRRKTAGKMKWSFNKTKK
jgi:ribosomal protein S6E (S10)